MCHCDMESRDSDSDQVLPRNNGRGVIGHASLRQSLTRIRVGVELCRYREGSACHTAVSKHVPRVRKEGLEPAWREAGVSHILRQGPIRHPSSCIGPHAPEPGSPTRRAAATQHSIAGTLMSPIPHTPHVSTLHSTAGSMLPPCRMWCPHLCMQERVMDLITKLGVANKEIIELEQADAIQRCYDAM